jgi:hypothetical protein
MDVYMCFTPAIMSLDVAEFSFGTSVRTQTSTRPPRGGRCQDHGPALDLQCQASSRGLVPEDRKAEAKVYFSIDE